MSHTRRAYYLEKIFEKLESGKLSPEAERLFRAWLADPRDSAVKERALYKLFQRTVLETSNPDRRAYEMLECTISKIRKQEKFRNVKTVQSKPAARQQKLWLRTLKIAGVLVPLLALQVALYLYKPAETPAPVKTTRIIGADTHSIETVLPCGSKVILNKQTEISYCEATYSKNREINLSGEAYLMVTKIAGSPFTVNTKNIKINVLGTVFNVNANDDSDHATVSLYDGSVEIETSRGTSLLTPLQEFSKNIDDNTSSVKNISGSMPAWVMATNVVSMKEIIEFIRKNYQMPVVVDETVDREKLFFLRLSNAATVHQIGTLLCELDKSVHYRIIKDTVYITNSD